MFKSIRLKTTYSSYEDNLTEDFYNPVLSESVKYDRATAYFSAKALAFYSRGLEVFARKGNLCRIIVSTQLSEDDYNQIKAGYDYRRIIDENLLPKLQETLSLDEEKNLSNLAYLISIGCIDIRIAFTQKGIFHDKFGVVEDNEGNIICFRGSNNETEAAIMSNYESFDITCSWQSSSFDYEKITDSINRFNKLWNNKNPKVIVKEFDEVLYSEIMKHNKNKIIEETIYLENNTAVLDYNGSRLFLIINKGLNPSEIWTGRLYKLKLKRFLDFELSEERTKYFKSGLNYLDFKKIISIFTQDANKRGYKFFVSNNLSKYIESKEIYIYERANAGLLIKQHSSKIIDKYENYKSIVDNEMIRPLREQQMWDSFYMCSMQRVSNFSVPGSGKTASVYGVYAYLKAQGFVNRIIMIGPKNSFGSWVDEFKACFGNKQELRLFNIQSEDYKSSGDKKRAVAFSTGQKNLLLFNYEGINGYINQLKTLVNDKTLLVLDEVHKVKLYNNEMGSRAQSVFDVSENAKYTIALTGTPIPNSYIDIYNLLHILYREEYDDFFAFEPRQLKKPTSFDIENINEKLQPFYCRTTKKQLNVPEPNKDLIIRTKASKDENDLFNILIQKYRKNKLTLMIRLLQLESSPKMLLKSLDLSDFEDVLDLSGDTFDIDYVDYSDDVKELINSIDCTEKFKKCIDKANELFFKGKKTIIWCIFIDSINIISAELVKSGKTVGCIYGDISQEERNSIIRQFKEGSIDFLITNPHTLAESVSLHNVCHDAIYFEYSYNLVHLLQSKDRIHRLGLPNNQYTQYYYLQQFYDPKEYSIDEQIYNRLKYKEDIMLNAIENSRFEEMTTADEDIDIIFNSLNL